MSRKKKKDKTPYQCNICRGPYKAEYQEVDIDTGKTRTRTEWVDCLGHTGIAEYLWNRHPNYDKYRIFRAQQKQNSQKKQQEKEENNA